jgi:hypothetical protein
LLRRRHRRQLTLSFEASGPGGVRLRQEDGDRDERDSPDGAAALDVR